MQGRWTIGKKLFTGVGVLIALLMASGATTLWTTRAMNKRLVHTGEKTVRRIPARRAGPGRAAAHVHRRTDDAAGPRRR